MALWRWLQYIDVAGFFSDDKHPLKKLAKILNGTLCYALGKEGYEEYAKVMLNPPPRFGKSYMITGMSVLALGLANNKCIMRNTSMQDLAETFSRDVRNMIQYEGFEDLIGSNKGFEGKSLLNKKIHDVFPELQLSNDKRALNKWALKTYR